ncbi:MAG: ATP-dependent Clp protease, protease subunit [Patescibacteria group bacterium]|nr:ATP-dependent Clp protease, protease subunit [Patescibacteria group bacterium]
MSHFDPISMSLVSQIRNVTGYGPFGGSSRPVRSTLIPTVIDKTPSGERVYDIYSRLLEDRIIFLGDAIDSMVANTVVAQMLFLEKADPKAPITLYVNSPGGHVTAGLAIYDTMQHIKPDVSTVCVGLAASMGAIILAGGTKGKRFSLPHSEIMIHQPLGGAEGQAIDIKIAAENIIKTGGTLYGILAKHTGKPLAQVEKDCDRDNFMSPEEALEYGLIDKIIKNR